MSPRQKRRLAGVLVVLIGLSAASALALNAFRDNLMFFYSPTEVMEGKAPPDHLIRIGGLVADNSFREMGEDLTVRFVITDTAENVPVEYTGVLPDLFREGQGVVAHGRLGSDGLFRAERVLAKHDENYMAPEVAEALEAAGYTGHTGDGGDYDR
ncbi:MAG: cytochrome c maturation protein CcmE [Ectothiorhodospiraceae bacterium]|nr:cytochrome c maturation protein CcmE [Ectothiorhodospiraceae bacterium]